MASLLNMLACDKFLFISDDPKLITDDFSKLRRNGADEGFVDQ